LTVKKATKAQFLIYAMDPSKALDYNQKAGFAVIKGDQNKHKEPSFQTVGAKGVGGAKPLSVDVVPNEFYTIIPYSKVPELEDSEYMLIVLFAEEAGAELTQLPAWKHCEVAEGDWVDKNAGGAAMDKPTFGQNPRFEVTLPKEPNVHFAVFLSQYENDPQFRFTVGQDAKIVNEAYATDKSHPIPSHWPNSPLPFSPQNSHWVLHYGQECSEGHWQVRQVGRQSGHCQVLHLVRHKQTNKQTNNSFPNASQQRLQWKKPPDDCAVHCPSRRGIPLHPQGTPQPFNQSNQSINQSNQSINHSINQITHSPPPHYLPSLLSQVFCDEPVTLKER